MKKPLSNKALLKVLLGINALGINAFQPKKSAAKTSRARKVIPTPINNSNASRARHAGHTPRLASTRTTSSRKRTRKTSKV